MESAAELALEPSNRRRLSPTKSETRVGDFRAEPASQPPQMRNHSFWSLVPRNYRMASALGRNELRIVLYHDISDGSGPFVDHLDVSTPQEVFANHLRVFTRDYDVVDLNTVLSGRLPRRPLLITFDDGYRSVVRHGVPVLRDLGLPSVFFVTAGALFGTKLILDNLLCYLANTVGLERTQRAINKGPAAVRSLGELIGQRVSALSYERRRRLVDDLADHFEIDQQALRRESDLYVRPSDLEALHTAEVEIANHTFSHLYCRCLDRESAQVEIVSARDRLTKWSGREVRAFSSPYGDRRDVTPVVQQVLKESGHEAVFLVEARTNGSQPQTRGWNRVSLNSEDESELFAKLEILPRVRTLVDRIRVRGHRHYGTVR